MGTTDGAKEGHSSLKRGVHPSMKLGGGRGLESMTGSYLRLVLLLSFVLWGP